MGLLKSLGIASIFEKSERRTAKLTYDADYGIAGITESYRGCSPSGSHLNPHVPRRFISDSCIDDDPDEEYVFID